MFLPRWLLLVGLLNAAVPLCSAGEPLFTETERAFLSSHGPWPPAPVKDPTNRYSGDPEAVALGARLFLEPRLSRTGTVSCATCHVPGRAFTDGKALSTGLDTVTRNTPTVLNTRAWRWFGWDGAADSLWAQSIRPILSAQEMDGAPPVRARR